MWPGPLDTQTLLRRAREGQKSAVEELLARHREPLRRMIAMRLDQALAKRVDASDVVQDVLIVVARRLDEYLRDPRMPFHLWLRQIAQDRIIDAHRKHRRAERRSVDREQASRAASLDESSGELVARLVDQELTPASAAIREEFKRRYEKALESLSEDDREILLMRHHEQLSNQDVAMALGLSEAAAGMRYLRALRRIRPLLT